MACNQGWHSGTDDPTPFIDYTLGVLLSAYREFESRLGEVTSTLSARELVSSVCAGMLGEFALRDLVGKIPTLSRASIEKAVRLLHEQGTLERRGVGRGTRYVCRK